MIVIAGTKNLLREQSTERIRNDLQIGTRPKGTWLIRDTVTTARDRCDIERRLADWTHYRRGQLDRPPPTVLLLVLKQHKRLRQLADALSGLQLDGVPALVIDDEADQASMNGQIRTREESAVHRCIGEVRSRIPHHTYLQYTATPQAPLLISRSDPLSPEAACLLSPGADYVGGKGFLDANPSLIRRVPDEDLPGGLGDAAQCPPSLRRALRLFLVGVAAGYVEDEGRGVRSMLIHPSHRTEVQKHYEAMVNAALGLCRRRLAAGTDDRGYAQEVGEFQAAYEDLKLTAGDTLPSFAEVLGRLREALRDVRVWLVNASPEGQSSKIPWEDDYAHILIGGQILERGYTVEGLTVTYMPRGPGGRQADTLQQRARFMGYKRTYLGLCRVFLHDDVHDALASYVEHEDALRNSLEEHAQRGDSLAEWQRVFILDPKLKPTRDNIIEHGYFRVSADDDWLRFGVPHTPDRLAESNRPHIEAIVSQCSLAEEEGHAERTEAQRPLVSHTVPLGRVYRELLELAWGDARDADQHMALLLLVERLLARDADARCSVYLMRGDGTPLRTRAVADSGRIDQLHAGRSANYDGDAQRRGEGLTLQVHRLKLTDGPGGPVVADDVYTLAVYVPREMGASIIVQSAEGRS